MGRDEGREANNLWREEGERKDDGTTRSEGKRQPWDALVALGLTDEPCGMSRAPRGFLLGLVFVLRGSRARVDVAEGFDGDDGRTCYTLCAPMLCVDAYSFPRSGGWSLRAPRRGPRPQLLPVKPFACRTAVTAPRLLVQKHPSVM